jgi:hypothetical protein
MDTVSPNVEILTLFFATDDFVAVIVNHQVAESKNDNVFAVSLSRESKRL